MTPTEAEEWVVMANQGWSDETAASWAVTTLGDELVGRMTLGAVDLDGGQADVGQDTFDANAVDGDPGDGTFKYSDRGRGLLIGADLDVGPPAQLRLLEDDGRLDAALPELADPRDRTGMAWTPIRFSSASTICSL